MINPKELENLEFDKSFMGGYNVESVDEFICSLNSDYEALFVENSDLKKKLTVLAQKIEEYKKDEDYIKGAILYSQKIRDDALASAKNEAIEYLNLQKIESEKIINEANSYAELKISNVDNDFATQRKEIESQLRLERNELALLKNEVSDFKAKLKQVYDNQMNLINDIPEFEHKDIIDKVDEKEDEKISFDVPVKIATEQITPDFINEIAEVITEKGHEVKPNVLEYQDAQKAKKLEDAIDLVLGDDTIIIDKGFDFPLKK